MNGSDRRSVNSKGGKNNKGSTEQSSLSVSQQLQEISAKLAKLDELEKLNKDLLGQLLKLSNRVDSISIENRLLKQEVENLKQEKLQNEILIKGFKLEQPEQHRKVFNGVCERVGYRNPEGVKEVRPLIFKNNKRTDAVLVKFRKFEDKNLFIQRIRSLKKPLEPREINIKSQNKFILVQDHLTPEKQKVHRQTWDLCKLGLQRPWFYKGSTWITHPETNKRFCVADSADVEAIEFILVTDEKVPPSNSPVFEKVTESKH